MYRCIADTVLSSCTRNCNINGKIASSFLDALWSVSDTSSKTVALLYDANSHSNAHSLCYETMTDDPKTKPCWNLLARGISGAHQNDKEDKWTYRCARMRGGRGQER